MQNQILNTLFMTFTGTVQGMALLHMLEIRTDRIKESTYILYWTVLACILSAINAFWGVYDGALILRQVVYWAISLFTLLRFFSDPVWQRITAFILVSFGLMGSELIVLILMHLPGWDMEMLTDKSKDISVLLIGIGVFFSVTIISIIASFWRKIFNKGASFKYFGLFLIYAVNHIATVAILNQEMWDNKDAYSSAWAMVTSLLCGIMWPVIMFSQSEKEEIERNLAASRQKMELEQIHIQEVKKNREKIVEISKHNSTEVNKIRKYLQADDAETAENELMSLLHKIEATKEYPYCEIPIINVILSEKKKECEEKKINLNVDIRIPETNSVKQMDLCSVYSNLMDNAIRANSNNDGNGWIHLTTAVVGEYLIIKCVNYAEKEPGRTPVGSGYGLKILQDIADRYHGNFQTVYKNHEYYAQLTLRS